MKNQGCCPINPLTGLPLYPGIDSEDMGKNAGRPPKLPTNECPTNNNPTNIMVANPVNVATGNKYEEVLDLKVSTPGIPLEFRRSYNSQVFFDGPLGYGWTHTYDVILGVVQTSPTKRIRIWDSDGRALYFNQVQQTSTEILFGGESGVKDRLKQVIATGEYFLRRKEGNLTYKFGSDGKLLQISDPNGNTITLTYTGGLLTQVSDNFGKSLSIQYSNNRISSVTDPKNQSVSYQYQNGDLWKVTYPDTNFITYAYLNHNLTDKYDTNNNLIGHWGYDNRHRVINYYGYIKDSAHQEEINLTYQLGSTVVTRSTGTTTYAIDVLDSIRVVTEIDGCSTCGSVHKRFDYTLRLDLADVTSVDGGYEYTTRYIYDNPPNPWEQVGEVLQKTEALVWPEQRTTNYSYSHRTDDPFLLTQSTETIKSVVDTQQNKVITLTYDTYGNILSRQESCYVFINGVATQKTYTTAYQYNALGQLTQINGPRTDVSDITTLEYYANTPGEGNNRGQLKAVVNALNQRTEFSQYDANGNVGKIKDPNNVETQYTYDERNRVRTITNLSTTAQMQYFYDIRGNLDHVILPEGNQIIFSYNLANKVTEIRDNLGNKIQYQYDVEGNRTREEVKDPQGTLKKYLDFTYDAYKHLKKIINPDANYTEYSYDGRGNRTAAKDPKNYTTTFTYDPLSRMKDMTQPLSIITHYGYDTNDNQASVTDPKGNITQYYNDDLGREDQTTSPDTGITKYLYDEGGNLNQRVDAKGTAVNYTYDALNRITSIQFPGDPNQNITFTYDSPSVNYGIGRLTGRADPSGSYTFHYDAHARLAREEKTINSILYTTQYTYNNNNILTSITYPTGRVITYVPDGVGRVSQVTTTLNGQPKTLASTIDYLPFGGIKALTYGNTLSLNQGYDNQYRISSIVAGSILNLTYGYDPNGNITSILDAINPPGGEVLENPGLYSYQQGTNKLTHIEGTPPSDFGYDANANITTENAWTYVYDLSNQLIRILDGSNVIVDCVYNGIGQRIKKILPTETRIFHYDLRGHLIAETNQSGQMLAEYVYLEDQLLVMIKPGETAYYYHNDHLGTPQILTSESQAVAWKAVYTPFGEAVTSIATVENPFRFPGQYYDPETGLHYNYFRYYDPTTGRYVTPDPIGLAGGTNLFVYTNNPVNRIDPWGLAPGDWWDPRTYIAVTFSGSALNKGFCRGTSGVEQETKTYLSLGGGSIDIYIGIIPSPYDRVYEMGAGFRHLGAGYFYGNPDISGNPQFGGLVIHIGAGVTTPIYFSVTEPARGLPFRTPRGPTYFERGRE
jgi:RHS repeat-associated protein